MKAVAVNEIKQELGQLPKDKLIALCLRLARFKKEHFCCLKHTIYPAIYSW
jgi:hypothetical protein